MAALKIIEAAGKKKKQAAIVVVSNSAQPKKKKKAKKNRKNNQNRKANVTLASRERQYFLTRLLAPSMFGPFRQPRSGSSTRTGLGIDLTDISITGSATNLVQGIQAGSVFDTTIGSVNQYAALSEGTALDVPTVEVSPGSSFPTKAQLADVNLTACDILVYYIGAPLNVTGEVIMGQCITIADTATYASLYFYPGTIKFPVAELIQCPKRVSMRKLSPIADEFVNTATGNADVDMPFCFTSGLPTGGTIKFLVTRTWEYRSTTVSASVVPYEKVGPDHSLDLSAYQDAKADIGAMESTVSEAVPGAAEGSFNTLVGLGTSSLLGGIMALRKRHNSRISQGAASPSSYEDISPVEQMYSMYTSRRALDEL